MKNFKKTDEQYLTGLLDSTVETEATVHSIELLRKEALEKYFYWKHDLSIRSVLIGKIQAYEEILKIIGGGEHD